MSEVIKKVDNLYYIFVGVQGENMSRQIKMDVSDWMEKYPNATIYILFKPYNAQYATPVATTYEDGILTWTPSTADTSVPGTGYAEVRLMYATDEVVMKSRVLPAIVENSASGLDGAEVPSPFEEWTNQILAAAEEITDNIDTAEEAAETAVAAAESITGHHDVPILVNFGVVTSFPVVKEVAGITSDMTVDQWQVQNPHVFKGGLHAEFSSGKVVLSYINSGIISGESSVVSIKVSTSVGQYPASVANDYFPQNPWNAMRGYVPGLGALNTFSTGTTTSDRPLWNGLVRANAKTLYLEVVVDKPLDLVSTVTVDTFTGMICGLEGAIDSSTTNTDWTDTTNYSISAAKSSNNTVRVTITKADDSAFGDATGSTPIIGSINTVLVFS